MNLNGDEKRIRQLFHEMSLDDQRRAPAFATVLEAGSGATRSRNRVRSWSFATAVVALCGALLIAMIIIVKPSKPQGSAGDADQAKAPIAEPGTQLGVIPAHPSLPAPGVDPPRAVKRAGYRRRSNQFALATTPLFAWKSPTASLLQTPDDELLRSLPRLGESLQTIKSFSPDQFN